MAVHISRALPPASLTALLLAGLVLGLPDTSTTELGLASFAWLASLACGVASLAVRRPGYLMLVTVLMASPAMASPVADQYVPVHSAVISTWVVRRGEHFWAIAEQHLTDRLDRGPTTAETASYWTSLVDANRESIRSGNPDLIHPGEVVNLP